MIAGVVIFFGDGPLSPVGTAQAQSDKFSDDFEDEAADPGLPDNWEYDANSGLVNETNVTTDKAASGSQSWYLEQDGTASGSTHVSPLDAPFAETTSGNLSYSVYQTNSGAHELGVFSGGPSGTEHIELRIASANTGALEYRNSSGTWVTIDGSKDYRGEWVDFTVYKINSSSDTWALEYTAGGTTKTEEGLEMKNPSSDGYDYFRVETINGGSTYYDSVSVVDSKRTVSGVVSDTDGDPVSNATVYATGYDAKSPPTIDGTPFDEIADDPLPDQWTSQVDEPWADRAQLDPSETEWSKTRVLMHTREDWDISGFGGTSLAATPEGLDRPKTVVEPNDPVVFSCWDFSDNGLDNVDKHVPGASTTSCEITVERIDPLGDSESKDTISTTGLVEVWSVANLGTKVHHGADMGDSLGEGVYLVYPEDNRESALAYAVAPDGNVRVLEADIENFASSRSEAISQYNQEIKNEYDAGNLELVSAKTNSTGHYSLDVPSQATKAELRVVKDGGSNAAGPGNLTRTDLRNEYDSAVRNNFNDATGISFEEAGEETFVDVCRRMDPIADDVGVPFYGSGQTDIPNQNADIQGQYVIPEDLQPRVRLCAAISIVESLLDGDLGWLSPGLSDDLSTLTDAELEAMLSTVQSMLGTNDVLCEEYASAVGAPSCEDALEDPSDLTRDELENRVTEGYDTVDDSSDNMNGGGGAGIVGGGGGGVDVGDGNTEVGDETFSTDWNVGGISDWDGAELMIRLTWSDGTTTVLNQSSEYVSVDESVVGSDTVQLSEYPIGNEDPAAVQARLDVVTQSSTGSGDTGAVKNPTWDGDIPSLNSLKVSKWEPGEQDSFTVGVEAADSSRFGSLQRVEVTSPAGTTTTYNTVENGEITAQTKNAGDHRVAVVFTANDDNATEFTEVVQVRAGSTSKGRPPSIRGQSGAIGRYAVVGHGLDAGEVDVARGGSEVTMTGVLPQDADVPKTFTADTTGMSVATDATTTVRLRRGATRQTIRDRINVVLYADEIDDDALVWRNGDALTREGTQWGEVTVSNGTTVDTISDETASVAIRVNGDPSVVDRVRHWVNANVNIPSLPGSVGFDIAPLLAVLVALRRRDPPEPPTPDVREHRQPNPQEV